MSMRRSMSWAAGFTCGSNSKIFRSFDWDKAARIISERKPKEAEAGLAEDWDCTSGIIWRDGTIIPREETFNDLYLLSNWATPLLVIDGEEVECWKDGKGEDAYWPESARKLVI